MERPCFLAPTVSLEQCANAPSGTPSAAEQADEAPIGVALESKTSAMVPSGSSHLPQTKGKS